MAARRTVGRELFSWLFSSLFVTFYLQPKVALSGEETVAVVLLVELVGFLIGFAIAGGGWRAALVRALAIPAILSVVMVLIFQPAHGSVDTIFLWLLGIQAVAALAAYLVIPSKRASGPSSG